MRPFARAKDQTLSRSRNQRAASACISRLPWPWKLLTYLSLLLSGHPHCRPSLSVAGNISRHVMASSGLWVQGPLSLARRDAVW